MLDPPPKSSKSGARRAAVLWKLLRQETRAKVAPLLEGDELEQLNRAFEEHRSSPLGERQRVEQELLRRSSFHRAPGPLIASLAMAILFVGMLIAHLVLVPVFPEHALAGLFSPLLFGVLGPLGLYLIPTYRHRLLFAVPRAAETYASSFFCLLGLIWCLVYIGLESPTPLSLTGLSLLTLLLGATTAPLIEEIAYRELLPSLFGPPPHYAGHLAAAMLFAASHVPSSGLQFLWYALSALFLSALRLQSDGLLAGVIVHSLANAIVLLFF